MPAPPQVARRIRLLSLKDRRDVVGAGQSLWMKFGASDGADGILSVGSLDTFELERLDPLCARSLIPVGIDQPVDCDNHAPGHEAARNCERDHEEGDIAPSEVFEHAKPRQNPGLITHIRRLGSFV